MGSSVYTAPAAIIDALIRIDEGGTADTSFLESLEVDDFCEKAGMNGRWGGKTFEELTEVSVLGPRVVEEHDSRVVMDMMQAEIDKGTFEPKYPIGTPDSEKQPFDASILLDFLDPPRGRGHIWEFQFAMGVELEHGRTRGTNVTNNQPLLTGMIVMAHLTEDRLYYARLWVMEVQGEIFNGNLRGEDTTDLERELDRAQKYLLAREAETTDVPLVA